MDIDRGASQAIEVVSESARLTASMVTFIFSTLANRLNKNGDKAMINSKSKEGKQKINNLLKKHKDGIQSLDDNLTKQQVKEYQKELKKLGVDFSIVKNEKDNYSFFFAGGQAEVIERGLQNVIELNEKVMENEDVKEAELELNSEMKDSSKSEIENANKAYNQYVERIEGKEEIPERENLTDKEKIIFDKTKELHETEKEVRDEVSSEIELEKTNDLTEDEIEKDPITNKDQARINLNKKISQLSDSELELFEKRMEYENVATSPSFDSSKTYQLADELKELQSKHSKDIKHKINTLDKGIRNLNNSSEKSDGNKLNANEILRETKKQTHNRKRKVFSVDNVKNMDKKIREESKDKERTRKKQQSL